MYICDYFWSTLTNPDNDRHQSTALLSCESLHTFTDIISVSLCSWLFAFFFFLKRWAREDGLEVSGISKYRWKIKLNRSKTFSDQMRKIFYFIRMKERFGVETKIIENDNTINKRNWKKSGKGMRKYRKEILIFPTLSPFLILSRYFFLFLYPRIPRSPSLPLSFILSLSVSLKRPSPVGV